MKKSLMLMSLLAMQACTLNTPNKGSQTKDIAVTINADGLTYYFQVADGNLIASRCKEGMPALQINCSMDPVSVPYTETRNKLLSDINSEITAIGVQINTTITGQMDLKNAIESAQINIDEIYPQVQPELEKASEIQSRIDEINNQIPALNEAIASLEEYLSQNPDSADVQEQIDLRTAERTALENQLATEQESIDLISSNDLYVEYKSLTTEMESNQAALDSLPTIDSLSNMRQQLEVDQVRMIQFLDRLDSSAPFVILNEDLADHPEKSIIERIIKNMELPTESDNGIPSDDAITLEMGSYRMLEEPEGICWEYVLSSPVLDEAGNTIKFTLQGADNCSWTYYAVCEGVTCEVTTPNDSGINLPPLTMVDSTSFIVERPDGAVNYKKQ